MNPPNDQDIRNIARIVLAMVIVVGIACFVIGRWTA